MRAAESSGTRSLTPDKAVDLLDQWLASRSRKGTAGLRAVFESAGSLASEFAMPKRLLSTRLLTYALISSKDAPFNDVEKEAWVLLNDLLSEKFDQVKARYLEYSRDQGAKPETGPTALTSNVRRLLESAARLAETREDDSITVRDILLCFPPPSSRGEELLVHLGIQPEELHRTILAYADEPSSPELTPETEEVRPQTVPDRPEEKPAQKQTEKAEGLDRSKATGAYNDRVSTHADEPATLDELGRAAFADILADRIREARISGQTAEPSAFIVHLHGPWGSGKSSVLNFLEDNLAEGSDPWIVVRFNAWRDQRLQPPWWRLITTIYYGARAKLGWRAPWLWLRWLGWRVRADYMPLLSVLVVASIATFLLWRFGWPVGGDGKRPPDWMDVAKWLLPLVITLLTAIYVNSRSLALGSRRAAQTYADIKDDPFKPIARLFNQLVDSIARPLVVFIDDLDRCDSKYVVELLEGIQTLMRGAAVTYVVAADRKWICSSFEQRYAGFSPPIGESGRPLGYLFLDKLFQVSAAIPQIPPDVQSSYWARLLSPTIPDPAQEAEARAEAARQAEQDAAALSRQEDLQALVQKASATGDRIRIQAVRAACAKRISSPEAVVRTEHRLQAFAHLLEPNPRAMKRLVNAYAMHQATLLLAGRDTEAGPLARWTILELRWPLLADFLAVRCECVDALRHRLADDELPQIPLPLRCLFGDELLVKVIGAEEDPDRLTTEVVNTILGAVQGDR